MINRRKQFVEAVLAETKDPKVAEKIRRLVEEEFKDLFELTPLEQYLIHEKQDRERRAEAQHTAHIEAAKEAVAPLFAVLAGFVKAKAEAPPSPTPSASYEESVESAFNVWMTGVGALFLQLSPGVKHDVLFTILEQSDALPMQTTANPMTFRQCLTKVQLEVGMKAYKEAVVKPGVALFEAWGARPSG